jgi:hypothetical protein
VRASTEPQKLYPRIGLLLRTLYLLKRGSDHMRKMDFSATPGRAGYICWRLGLVGFWQKHLWKRIPRPEKEVLRREPIALPVVDADAA